MPRKVFFSFHFQRDSRKVAQIRNSRIVGFDETPFLDRAAWETIKRTTGIKKWIDDNLYGTSVTVVLIGQETYKRPWVKYEIEQSEKLNKGIIGIYLHNINDPLTGKDRETAINPFVFINDRFGNPLYLSVPTYDWVHENGRQNIAKWVEAAAIKVGR